MCKNGGLQKLKNEVKLSKSFVFKLSSWTTPIMWIPALLSL